jgi:hypothetical protein
MLAEGGKEGEVGAREVGDAWRGGRRNLASVEVSKSSPQFAESKEGVADEAQGGTGEWKSKVRRRIL